MYRVDYAISIILIIDIGWLCLHLDDQISSWTFDKYRYRYEIRKLRSRVTISHSWKSLVGKLDGTIRVPWESSRSRYTDLLLLNNSALTSTTLTSISPPCPLPTVAFHPLPFGEYRDGNRGKRESMEKHSFSRRVNPTIGAQGTFSKIFPSLILLFFNDLFLPFVQSE